MHLNAIIRRADIAALYAVAPDGLARQLGGVDGAEALLRGSYRQTELRPGLSLHATDAIELTDLTSRFEHEPGLSILLFLQGHVDVSFGARRLTLGRRDGVGNDGVLVLRNAPEPCVRRSRAGTHIRKISLTVTFDWLSAALRGSGDAALADLVDGPDRLMPLALTPRLAALAEQILRPPTEPPILANLLLEQRAIALIAEALRPLVAETDAPPTAATPPARDAARLARVGRLIEAADPGSLSLDALARAAGMSEAALQRLFKLSYGTSVFDHIRARRMEAAYAALVGEHVSVAEAAHRAGYGSAANFATAFKRRYGVSPKSVRG